MSRTYLILGGARSGKSSYGEELAKSMGGRTAYLATSIITDREMEKRIKLHRKRRPPDWITLELDKSKPDNNQVDYIVSQLEKSNIDNLLDIEPNDHTVVSWSLNSQRMIEQHEVGAVGLSERIDAARKCQQHGYRIRFRIDPGILYPSWQVDYADLIKRALTIVMQRTV